MVSAKIINAKPQSQMADLLKKLSLKRLFVFHKDKKKEQAKERELIEKQNEPRQLQPTKTDAVASILETFKKLDLEPTKITKVNREECIQEDDEFDNFTIKVVEDDRRSARIDSQSSTDSGFTDKDEVTDELEKLAIDDKSETETDETKEIENDESTETKDDTEKGKRKLLQVLVKRAPVRNKVSDYSVHPYGSKVETENTLRQISQINKQTLTGGHLIVNTPDNYSELDLALKSVSQIYQTQPDNEYLNDLLEYINEDTTPKTDDLSEFKQINDIEPNFHIEIVPEKVPVINAIEEFNDSQQIPFEDSIDFPNSILFPQNESIFPTPPRSENVPSPMSESQAFYASNSEYTLSPERSSPVYNSDFEKYQEISPLSFDDEEKETKRPSVPSTMTMKNFKDLQKEITNGFSKKECCDINRKPTKQVFEEHMRKLKAVERKNLCFKVSKLDMKTAYGVLHHTMLALSRDCPDEDLQYALFALVCQRVLAQNPQLFAGDFGLSILKAAALRCPHRPLLTRHIVHCVYLVLRNDPTLCTNECVFHEVDALGDNLVIACARGGDAYALVLAEISRSDMRGELPPLFRLHHANADGHTALHVACREHSAANSRLHTVHVLLEHASADIWKGDIKGGDTPLHLAVNSTNCCLRLVMMLFKHIDRKEWKKLAHAHNMSSVTPLEYARSATKSTTRQNYPPEVLDFLKKCR